MVQGVGIPNTVKAVLSLVAKVPLDARGRRFCTYNQVHKMHGDGRRNQRTHQERLCRPYEYDQLAISGQNHLRQWLVAGSQLRDKTACHGISNVPGKVVHFLLTLSLLLYLSGTFSRECGANKTQVYVIYVYGIICGLKKKWRMRHRIFTRISI